jgi:hypothetical protein
MQTKLMNEKDEGTRFPRVKLAEPLPSGFVHVAAEVDARPPFLPNSRKKRQLLACCKECLERVRRATAFEIEAAQLHLPTRQAHLPTQSLRKTSDAIVNLDFFRSGHKRDSLQLAYAEARAARF